RLRLGLGGIEAQIHVFMPLIGASHWRARWLARPLHQARPSCKIWVAIVISVGHIGPHRGAAKAGPGLERGRSSGVEHNLAKVRVVSSNLIARSKSKRAVRL